MATGTFSYNALRTKTLKIKTQKIVSHSNSTRAMLLVWERLLLNHIVLYVQRASFGSQGIVLKFTAAIFFLKVDRTTSFPGPFPWIGGALKPGKRAWE